MDEQTISPLAADQEDSFFITEKCSVLAGVSLWIFITIRNHDLCDVQGF